MTEQTSFALLLAVPFFILWAWLVILGHLKNRDRSPGFAHP